MADRDPNDLMDDGKVGRELAEAVQVDGLQVELEGYQFAETPEFGSEAIGFLAAIIILLVAFGSVLAMGLPLITALFGIGTGSRDRRHRRQRHRRCRASRASPWR